MKIINEKYRIYILDNKYLLFFFIYNNIPLIYTLSLHDALPISEAAEAIGRARVLGAAHAGGGRRGRPVLPGPGAAARGGDRKSTCLNSSHVEISYAVFCLKKKKNTSQV